MTPEQRPGDAVFERLSDDERPPRRAPGRPAQVSTRVSEAELMACTSAATANGESLGDWLRRVAIRSADQAVR